MLLSAIHKLVNSVWKKEKLPDQWKESIIVPVHIKADKTNCNNYRGISLLSTSSKVVRKLRFPMIFHNEKHVYWH
jgi:hypothetical protein